MSIQMPMRASSPANSAFQTIEMAPQVLLSTDPVDTNLQSDIPVTSNLSDINKSHMEPDEDEDEDEDIDFNPFLRGSPAEASSSLSSEIEALDLDVVESGGEVAQSFPEDSAHKQADVSNTQIDESMARSKVTLEEAATRKSRKRKTSGPEEDSFPGEENCLDSEAGNDDTTDDTRVMCQVPSVASDDEDAICRRTRARYSLASFTLDELETFLQETDDDDDLPNVDDEEEYRKFLAAVLQGGDKDDQSLLLDHGNDEDEDNDADFEIEIEEALESDVDDCLVEKVKPKGAKRRPETRQNRRRKACSDGKKRLLELEKKPLRPLLPILPTTLIAPTRSNVMADTPPNIPPSGNSSSLNGFTPHQIGQLHCLIHEHVQLLIQVFSLCVLEPSKRNVATQVQGLISEMLNQRDQVLSRRDVPHPSFCFQPPYIHPSVVDEHPKYLPQEKSPQSNDMNEEQREISSSINKSQGSPVLQSCNENGRATKDSVETFQAGQDSSWLPFVGGPVLSILDVAPLQFVGKFMDDISTAVQEQMKRYVEVTSDLKPEKQPLFPLPVCSSISEHTAATANRGAPASSEYSTGTSPSPNHRQAKKTLAGTLVESSKKQSVALVPKRIAELSRQFYPLFNPALFPHKPPPLGVANRVLFTDAEDELLAMGLMECNTDWKAIQQRFLPCKSKHQIFVRQKNRCSSKAPDNPIKEVRKLKTSPLTEEEKARINEGLTAFKLDWMSIWKFIVPYRDPSLLPRQWRTALGTQKSYKKIDPIQREQRRIYEINRRRNKTLAAEKLQVPDKEDEHAGVPNENGEECSENNDEAYVHEAFLADWRPAPSIPISETSTVNLNSSCQPNNLGNHDPQAKRDSFAHELTAVSDHSQKGVYGIPRPVSTRPNGSTFQSPMNPSTFVCSMRPYKARKHKTTQLVRLAPSLPPVNLPSNVRVIPQASFQNSQHGTRNQTTDARRDVTASGPNLAVHPNSGLSNMTQKRRAVQQSKDQSVDQENGTEPELQMHPLLFQAPGNGHLPYYPLSSGTITPNSFSFFPLTPHPVNIPTLQNSGQPRAVAGSNKTTSKKASSSSLEFHPLLQRNDSVNNGSKATRQSTWFSTDLQPSRDPVSCSGAANELDLGINLNSSPRKENDLAADGIEVLTPRTGGTIGVMNSADDQSLPEIVMEQEELSDSDEEEEMENVEFEREEMADSEGEEDEEPYSLQILNTQNKQQPGATLNMNGSGNLSETAAHRNPESLQCRSEMPPEAGLSDRREDVVRSPWLSLSSQPSVSNADAIIAASNLDSTVVSHSNSSQKNSNPRGANNSKSGLDVQQPALVISSPARKRGSRASSSLNTDAQNSSCRRNKGG